MKRIINKKEGASMLLAISIFLFFTVLGINVLAAAYSTSNNVRSKYETAQTMQYVNSVQEIMSRQIQNGAFDLEAFLTTKPQDTEKEVIVTKTENDQDWAGYNGEIVKVRLEFVRTSGMVDGEIKGKIYVTVGGKSYYITNLYKKVDGITGTSYELIGSEGVSNVEN